MKKEPRNLPAPPKFEIFNEEKAPKIKIEAGSKLPAPKFKKEKEPKMPIPKIEITSSSVSSVSESGKKMRTNKKPKPSDEDWLPPTPNVDNVKVERKTRASARRRNRDNDEVKISLI